MFTIAARQMGYRVHTLSPDTDTPTGQIADQEITAAYEDLDAVRDFAKNVSAVTFEFENVPTATAEMAARHSIVRPAGDVLHTTQNRLREKRFLQSHGFPVAPFHAVRGSNELIAAFAKLGGNCILKTAAFGYDGKGQQTITSTTQAAQAIKSGDTTEYVLEGLVNFEKEVSVVAARSAGGEFVDWGVIENDHRHHILDLSFAPGNVSPAIARQATEIARGVLEALNVVGVLCVEMFVTASGLVVNELAPRPHNSGHLTIDACVTSQFEQQVRAVCGLPLGSTRQHQPAAMANLLGDLWAAGEPNWPAALAFPGVMLHLYGKAEPRPGRKMGHLTALGDTPEKAASLARQARDALTKK
jgi:5-(carboxyamino)imidazole ribonucleotide synthase